jgi:hypothetical protein
MVTSSISLAVGTGDHYSRRMNGCQVHTDHTNLAVQQLTHDHDVLAVKT